MGERHVPESVFFPAAITLFCVFLTGGALVTVTNEIAGTTIALGGGLLVGLGLCAAGSESGRKRARRR